MFYFRVDELTKLIEDEVIGDQAPSMGGTMLYTRYSTYESCHEKTYFLHVQKTKAQISCVVTMQLISAIDSTIPLLPKSEISSL